MPERLYRIGDAAEKLGLKTYVLRYWETEFPALRPVRSGKGQRRYTQSDVELLGRIRYLLHEQGMTIEGARRVLSGDSALSLVDEPSLPGTGTAEADRNRDAGSTSISGNIVPHGAESGLCPEQHAPADPGQPVQLSFDFRVVPRGEQAKPAPQTDVPNHGGAHDQPNPSARSNPIGAADRAEQTISRVAAELRAMQRLLRTPHD